MGVILDDDHDFEGLRSPRAHLDTVLRNLSSHLGIPRRRTVKSTMASRVASPAEASNATVVSSITWRQFGREGGSRALQGRLTGWCNSR
eukprot:scaffold20094_cov24-Phaeocystis_antarctica.AAC.1